MLVMAGVMVFYIILGCVMDEMSMILLTVPTLFPVIMGMDFFGLNVADKALWFGILILTVCEIGMIVPPVGINLFVIQGVAQLPMQTIVRGITPFVIADCLRMLLLAFIPALATWLPSGMPS